MFYVSSLKYNKNAEKLWGITDTDDNVTEYFTEAEVRLIFDKIGYTSIKGATFTGSKIKFERVTPVIIKLSELEKGNTITLSMQDGVHNYTICGITGLGDGWVVKENGVSKKLLKKYLLEHKDIIKIV